MTNDEHMQSTNVGVPGRKDLDGNVQLTLLMSNQTNKTHHHKYEKPPLHVDYDEPLFTPDLMRNPLEDADEMYMIYHTREANVTESND